MINEMLKILPTFWRKDSGSNVHKFFESFEQALKSGSNNITGLRNSVFLRTSTGTDLDDFAKLFGLTRESSETDSSFRIRIQNHWLSYNRGGLLGNMLITFSELLNIPISDIDVTEDLSQGLVKLVGNLGELKVGVDIPSVEFIQEKIDAIKAAGVHVQLLFSPVIVDLYSMSFDTSLSEVDDISVGVGGFVPDVYLYDGVGELI